MPDAPMRDASQSRGLSTIFSFFLGLLVTAVVGVGVYTFHGPPRRHDIEARDLERQQQALQTAHGPNELTPADRAELQRLQRARDAATDAATAEREAWGRRTSIVLVVLATLVMAVSLVQADRLPVVSNGLLLGGVFTMLYGVGWTIASSTSATRFVVLIVALSVTLALGYVRFVRRGPAMAPAGRAGPAGPETGPHVAALEARVSALEARLDRAATALGEVAPDGRAETTP